MFEGSDMADNFPLFPMAQQTQDLDLLTLRQKSSAYEEPQPAETRCDGGDKLK